MSSLLNISKNPDARDPVVHLSKAKESKKRGRSLGMNGKGNRTYSKRVYQGKEPVFHIRRKLSKRKGEGSV